MQEKKFKVTPTSDVGNFKKGEEYWVYNIDLSDREKPIFLLYDETAKEWKSLDASSFVPVKDKSAGELLEEFQGSMKKAGLLG